MNHVDRFSQLRAARSDHLMYESDYAPSGASLAREIEAIYDKVAALQEEAGALHRSWIDVWETPLAANKVFEGFDDLLMALDNAAVDARELDDVEESDLAQHGYP